MITVQLILRQVPGPVGLQGIQQPLFAVTDLILLSLMSGRKGMKAAFHLGRSLSRPQLRILGHASPCHATLTEPNGDTRRSEVDQQTRPDREDYHW